MLSEYQIAFKGGTYLWFFHGLRRFSEDLDFTSTGKLPADLAHRVFNGLQLYGVENQLKILKDNINGLSFRILANGPLNTGDMDRCSVYVEISKRERLLSETVPMKLDMPAYQMPVKLVRGMGLDEVGAEKVRAILTRKKARDIYDLFFLVSRKNIGFRRDFVSSKLEFYSIEFDRRDFFKEIASRERDFHRELSHIVLDEIPEFKDVVDTFTDWIS